VIFTDRLIQDRILNLPASKSRIKEKRESVEREEREKRDEKRKRKERAQGMG
jgi:hypothetical protein